VRPIPDGAKRGGLPAIGLAWSLLGGVLPIPAQDLRPVAREDIAQAMKHSQGYDLTATANGPRLQAEVLLRLVHEARLLDPSRRPLLLGHREWFEAFLERTGLTESSAPLYVRLANQLGQDTQVDYRREDVVEAVVQGPEPITVANVRISWPDVPGRPSSYSYDDVLSRPPLRVTQKRLITYRLVDYGDRVWYAEVSGLHGRPTSGALGLLFDLIGEARVVESRSAFSTDGYQVVRGRARKLWIDRTETVTVWPDGHAERGVPPQRVDLMTLEARLREPLSIRFRGLSPEARLVPAEPLQISAWRTGAAGVPPTARGAWPGPGRRCEVRSAGTVSGRR
jgi:hypothetical protein